MIPVKNKNIKKGLVMLQILKLLIISQSEEKI